MAGDIAVPVLVFDGDCGFCTVTAHWAQRRFRHGESAQPWQRLSSAVLDSWGLSLADVKGAAWWVDARGGVHRGHRAVGYALKAGGGWRRWVGTVILTPPTSWLAAGVYRLVDAGGTGYRAGHPPVRPIDVTTGALVASLRSSGRPRR